MVAGGDELSLLVDGDEECYVNKPLVLELVCEFVCLSVCLSVCEFSIHMHMLMPGSTTHINCETGAELALQL